MTPRSASPIAVLLLSLLALSLVPLTAIAQDADGPRCYRVPEVLPGYEWEYVDRDGTRRFEEVLSTEPFATARGDRNVTTVSFDEFNDGKRERWGHYLRIAWDSPSAGAWASYDQWVKQESGRLHIIESWSPALKIGLEGRLTCQGPPWMQETVHRIVNDDNPPTKHETEERWQARALGWEEVTVPAGTFDALHVRAVRENDLLTVDHWWSPEAKAWVKQTRGPNDAAPTTVWELKWYILDQRPVPHYRIDPAEPVAGDTVVLDGTSSFDPDGNITSYTWTINGETYEGPTVTLRDVEEGNLGVRLFVTDEVNRTATVGTSLYVPSEPGGSVTISGPLAAGSGEIVRLTAETAFDPLRIRWRDSSGVVGDGEVYSFRMNQTARLQIDAVHPSGRVYTAEHTVTRLNQSELAARSGPDSTGSTRGERQWPVGGSELVSFLEPLEGQVVTSPVDVRLWTSRPASLSVDGEEVWSGDGPEAETTLKIEPGRHTLTLTSSQGTHVINITVNDPGANTPAGGDPGAAGGDEIPAQGLAFLIGILGLTAALRRRR